ncbi:1621_t:CDS:2, partial [Ambispora leptoticha]
MNAKWNVARLFENTNLSTLNLSLRGVALKRDRMNHESEVLL